MNDIFRVCIMGRYYDIPTSEISSATLEALSSLVDESNNINPRDLLRTFLEYSEINNVLKSAIVEANQKVNFNLTSVNNAQEKYAESSSDSEEHMPLAQNISTQTNSN